MKKLLKDTSLDSFLNDVEFSVFSEHEIQKDFFTISISLET